MNLKSITETTLISFCSGIEGIVENYELIDFMSTLGFPLGMHHHHVVSQPMTHTLPILMTS